VVTRGKGPVATVHHPRTDNGYVSLRTSVTDKRGNTVEQTVIRAYRLANG